MAVAGGGNAPERKAGPGNQDLLGLRRKLKLPSSARASASDCPAGSSSRAAGAGGSPRKGVFAKTAAQGWSGSSELSDLFAKRLSIGGGAGDQRLTTLACSTTSARPALRPRAVIRNMGRWHW